jgi:hypothetical protein
VDNLLFITTKIINGSLNVQTPGSMVGVELIKLNLTYVFDNYYQAVFTYGILPGSLMGLKRIFRCHPWSKGGIDLPLKKSKNSQT